MTGRRRRAAGEGSIFQLPNGKWRAVVDLGWVDGKRSRKAVTRDTYRQCTDWLTEVKSAQQIKALPARTPTVAQWFETYLSEVAAGKVRRSTLANYRRDFERHIRPGLGRVKLDVLRPEHLSRFYADRLLAGLSAYAVRTCTPRSAGHSTSPLGGAWLSVTSQRWSIRPPYRSTR